MQGSVVRGNFERGVAQGVKRTGDREDLPARGATAARLRPGLREAAGDARLPPKPSG